MHSHRVWGPATGSFGTEHTIGLMKDFVDMVEVLVAGPVTRQYANAWTRAVWSRVELVVFIRDNLPP